MGINSTPRTYKQLELNDGLLKMEINLIYTVEMLKNNYIK